MEEKGASQSSSQQQQQQQECETGPRPCYMPRRDERRGIVGNCFSEPQASEFNVRGPDYLESGTKIPGGDNQYVLLGIDFVLTDEHTTLGKIADIPYLSFRKWRAEGYTGFVLIINFIASIGNFITYWGPSSTLRKQHRTLLENAGVEDIKMKPYHTGGKVFDSLIEKFVESDDDYRTPRLKIIPVLVEGSYLLSNVITGKPAILCTKITTKWSKDLSPENSYLEGDLDLYSSSVAVGILNMTMYYLQSVVCDLAFTIEGQSRRELPEEILGALRFHSVDTTKAQSHNDLRAEYFRELGSQNMAEERLLSRKRNDGTDKNGKRKPSKS